jgi:HSP20 family molecular chaperone IbpA
VNTLVHENRDGDRVQADQFVAPPSSVIEGADGYTLQIEMPGVNKQGLEVSVEQRANNCRAPFSSHCRRNVDSS